MRSGWVALIVLGLVGAAQAGVVSPYTNDFSGAISDFTLGGNGTWSQDTSAGILTINNGTGSGTYAASVASPGLSGESFSLSARFVMPALGPPPGMTTERNGNGGSTYVGLSAQASTTGLTTGYSIRGFGTSTLTSQLQIFRGSTSVANATSGYQWRNFVGDTFVITLSGTYNEDGSLDLTGTIANITDATSKTATYHENAGSVLSGQNFGLLDSYNSSNLLQVNYDSMSLVPEPASLTGILLAAGLLMRRRRSGLVSDPV